MPVDTTDKPQAVNPPARKPYKPPKVVVLGTIRDLTLSAGSSGADDGGKGGRKKTR